MKNLKINRMQRSTSLVHCTLLFLLVSCFCTTEIFSQSNRFYPDKNDYYTISLNGKNLSAKVAKAEGNIELASPSNSDLQKFRLVEQLKDGKSTNYYLIESKAKKGLFVTIHYSRIKEGTNIKLNPRKNKNQLWTFKNGAIETALSVNKFIGNLAGNNLVIVDRGPEFTFTKVASATPPSSGSAITVKAADLESVNFSKGGKPNGSFVHLYGNKWVELKNNSNNIHARFEEVKRDEFSVYLLDRKRNIRVKLDLHTKKVVIVNDPAYDITAASDQPRHLGFNVGKVRIQGTTYVKMFDKEWHSLWSGPNPVDRIYIEESAGKNGIRLINKFDKVVSKVHIDLIKKQVTNTVTGGMGASNGTFTSPISKIENRKTILPGTHPKKLVRNRELGPNSYNLSSAKNPGKLIDVYGGKTGNGSEVNFWGKNDSKNQLFWFAPVSNIEYMMIPQLNKKVVVGYSNKKTVSIKTGMQLSSTGSPSPNRNLSVQLFRLDVRAGTYVAIKTKEGYFCNVNGKLVISKKYTGIDCLFHFSGSKTPRPADLIVPPTVNDKFTDAEIKDVNFVTLKNGKLYKYQDTDIWVRTDNNNKIIDILNEESRKGGVISLKTENTLATLFPFNLKFSDLKIKPAVLLDGNNVILDEVKSTHWGAKTLTAGFKTIRMIKFNGVVTMLYESREETYTDGCSGGAPREKKLFEKACDGHDDDWAAPWNWAGFSNEVGQKISDAIFYEHMNKISDQNGNIIDPVAAGFFYRSVRSTEEAQNNFLAKRKKEDQRHLLLYKPDLQIVSALSSYVKKEYGTDILDHGAWLIGKTKDLFEDDIIPFFESIF